MDLENCDNKVWFINCPFCNLNQNKGDLFYSKRKKKYLGLLASGLQLLFVLTLVG